MEKQYYYAYSKYLKEKYGEKVYKLPVNFRLPVRIEKREADVSFVQMQEQDLKQKKVRCLC